MKGKILNSVESFEKHIRRKNTEQYGGYHIVLYFFLLANPLAPVASKCADYFLCPYRMIPFIGLMYRTFGKYRKENMRYLKEAERTIIEWISE